MRAWLGADYVQGSLCAKMPDLMRKDVDKLIADYQGAKTQPDRFTRKEQAVRAAAAKANKGSETREDATAAASTSEPGIPDSSPQVATTFCKAHTEIPFQRTPESQMTFVG